MVGQRRDEARQQITMGAMQFQHIKTAAFAAFGGRDEIRLDPVHRGAIHFARHPAVREVGNRRCRNHVPAALLQRGRSMPSHISLVAPLRPAWPSCSAIFAAELVCTKSTMRAPGGLLLIVPQSGAARGDAGIAADAGHFREHQSGSADRARAVMHQMEIAGYAFPGRVHAHRRYHGAVGHRHLAQAQRLEHRRHGLIRIDVKPLGANLLRKRLVDLADEIRRPQGQIVVGDRLGARHHAERELHGIEIPEAVDMLEPDQRNVGGRAGFSRPLRGGHIHIAEARPRCVDARCMASASAIASSIASLVPEPIEKCAVALASPSSTMLSLTQRLLRIIGKLRHIERLVRS